MKRIFFQSFAVCIIAFASLSTDSLAAQAPSPAAAVSAAIAEADAFYQQGKLHYQRNEYEQALAYFQKSLEKRHNWKALFSAGMCLKLLNRYDEALEKFEELQELQRELPPLPKEFNAETNVQALLAMVGTIEIKGDVPQGASLFIDERRRGTIQPNQSFRVSVGTRKLRVEKDGFSAIERTVEVEAERKNEVQLVAPVRKGRLVVNEKHNWVVHVEVDGVDVGVTPYQGLFSVGEHRVRLRGFMGVEALATCEAPATLVTEGAKVGSDVRLAQINLYENTVVTLNAEELDGQLRVGTNPTGAEVKIDGRVMGKAPWNGRLALGEHIVEVSAPGFVDVKQRVVLEKRETEHVSIPLPLEPKRKVALGVSFGIGGLGLGMFAIAGGFALGKLSELEKNCPNKVCPSTEKANQDTAEALGTVSTVGLVMGVVGTAAGTTLWVLNRRGVNEEHTGSSMNVSLGIGRFAIGGSF